eukprot:scaffold107002_cov28-Prasinocladus_malaysianus.AAC.1
MFNSAMSITICTICVCSSYYLSDAYIFIKSANGKCAPKVMVAGIVLLDMQVLIKRKHHHLCGGMAISDMPTHENHDALLLYFLIQQQF